MYHSIWGFTELEHDWIKLKKVRFQSYSYRHTMCELRNVMFFLRACKVVDKVMVSWFYSDGFFLGF